MSAYTDGQAAYWACKSQSDNPHAKESAEHSEWLSGFSDEVEADNEYENDDDDEYDDWGDDDGDDDI